MLLWVFLLVSGIGIGQRIFTYFVKEVSLYSCQCDQIWRFIGLWATFWSLWQQLICPNLPHSYAIFVKLSKSFIFLVKPFLGNFYRHLAIFFWSHWQRCKRSYDGQPLFYWTDSFFTFGQLRPLFLFFTHFYYLHKANTNRSINCIIKCA